MRYQGIVRLQCVIFDWAGTVVDFGSFAPTRIFVEAFASIGITISLNEARGPMGLPKIDHIRTLCDQPEIRQRFQTEFHRFPSEDDVKKIYERFMPLQISKVGDYSQLIPGALDTIHWLREQKLKIGSTSGYPKVVMNQLIPRCAAAGYSPDCIVSSDEVPQGRPGPSQALANVIALGIDHVGSCVKVDDTLPGILEGRNAGMWTVGLRFSGNFLGLTWEEYQSLSSTQLEKERERIDQLFSPSRPHYLIDTIQDLPSIISQINHRLSQGDHPGNN